MTQPTLDFTAAPASLNERLAAYFKQRPNQFIDGRELAKVAGNYAWRSRCSDLRKPPFGMTISNRQRRIKTDNGKFTISEYIFIP